MIYKLMPRGYKERIENLLKFSGSQKKPEKYVNYAFVSSLVIGFVIGFLLLPEYFMVMGLLCFLGMFAFFHGLLILAVDRRTRFVETILPDALQIIAANVRSGFIPSRAMLISARKEFGPLSEGIKNMGKEMMSGRSFQESLDKLTETVKSDVLERTVELLKKGSIAGGQLVSLFEQTSIDMRRRETINKEVKANILMYGIFIGFAGCVGAPVLYGLSSHLVATIARLGSVMYIPDEYTNQLPLMHFGLDLSMDFLMLFSVVSIIITTVFGGLLIGLIGTGKEKAGIKYIPVLMITALIIFFVTRIVVGTLFAALIPG